MKISKRVELATYQDFCSRMYVCWPHPISDQIIFRLIFYNEIQNVNYFVFFVSSRGVSYASFSTLCSIWVGICSIWNTTSYSWGQKFLHFLTDCLQQKYLYTVIFLRSNSCTVDITTRIKKNPIKLVHNI